MFHDRVHPDGLPERPFWPSPDSPRSSASSAQSFIPKPPPPPGDYIVQIEKDQILRVPPPENANIMASYARRATQRRGGGCLRCLACVAVPLLILIALAAAAAAAGVLYLVFRPTDPIFSIDSLSVKGFNLSAATAAALSPEFLATVRFENPNRKIGFYYLRGGDVTVSYGGVNLCHGAWPAFFQGRQNVTVLQSALTGSGIRLSSAMRQALVTAQNRRHVPLLIDARVPVRVKVGAVTSWTITVEVRCDVTLDKLTTVSKIVAKLCRAKAKI